MKAGRFLKDGDGALTEGGPGLTLFAKIFLLAFASLTVILSLLSCYLWMKRKCCRHEEDKETGGEMKGKDVEARLKSIETPKQVKKVKDVDYIENTLQFASSFVKMCLDKKTSVTARRPIQDYASPEVSDEEQPTSARISIQEKPDLNQEHEPTVAEF
jgi:hypothetical protein